MKLISNELLNKLANALASMTGMSYLQVQGLINEMNQLKDVETPKTEKLKPVKK